MLGMNIYDSDTVAFSATGKISQTFFVKGFFFLFFFSHARKLQAV